MRALRGEGRFLVVVGVLAASAMALVYADAAEACVSRVSGDFSSYMLPEADCDSPVGLCTEGTLGGDIEGDYDFTATAIYPLWPADDPYLFLVVGESVIYTDDGELYSQDYGTMNYATGELYNTITFTGGSEDWEDVLGSLIVSGTLDFTTGVIDGSYRGRTVLI